MQNEKWTQRRNVSNCSLSFLTDGGVVYNHLPRRENRTNPIKKFVSQNQQLNSCIWHDLIFPRHIENQSKSYHIGLPLERCATANRRSAQVVGWCLWKYKTNETMSRSEPSSPSTGKELHVLAFSSHCATWQHPK